MAVVLLLISSVSLAQEKHQAQSAYDFLQSIGVNSAIYRRGESVERTIECINYIGARWIRTDESMSSDEQVAVIKQLTDATGVKISTSLGSGGSNIDDLIQGSRRMAEMGVLLAIEGNNVDIKVTDSGIGIADIDMAIQPFFTTKTEEEHSGMGFTLMDSFMNFLEVQKNKPSGTIVHMKKVIKG